MGDFNARTSNNQVILLSNYYNHNPLWLDEYLGIIIEECHNNKSDLFCCFVDFRKSFDTMPRNNPWNRLEELKVPFELRVAAIRLYEKFIVKFKNS